MTIEAVFKAGEHFRFAHGSTLAETKAGLLCAWFAGRYESHPSTAIWASQRLPDGWSAPRKIIDHDGVALWNPVLHRRADGELLLFYRAGETPWSWSGRLSRSKDEGAHWSEPETLKGAPPPLGPIRSGPLERPDGTLLCPSSREELADEEAGPWRAHIERFDPKSGAWSIGPAFGDPQRLNAIQPSLCDWGDGRILALCRTQSGAVGAAWSMDDGESWTDLEATTLPNPNSAVDVARIPEGPAILAHNPSAARRSPLLLSLSDDGSHWRPALTLASGGDELAYPSLRLCANGDIAVSWTKNYKEIMVARLAARDVIAKAS